LPCWWGSRIGLPGALGSRRPWAVAYVEIRKNGKLISSKEITSVDQSGRYILHLEDGSELRLRSGQPVCREGLEYTLAEGAAGPDKLRLIRN